MPENHINKVISAPTISAALKMLTDGAADYMMIDDYGLQIFRQTILSHNLLITPSYFEPLQISIASDNGKLIREVNLAIEEMEEDGTLEKLYNKWLIIDDETRSDRYLYGALFISLSITILALLVIFILRRFVKKADRKASNAQLQNQELIYAINLLLKSSNTEILMFNEITRKLSVLRNGIFIESDVDMSVIESLIHPDDLDQYHTDYNSIKTRILIISLQISEYMTHRFKIIDILNILLVR